MLQSKKRFCALSSRAYHPVENFYTNEKAGIKLGSFEANYSDDTAKMEAFARVLWGLAPL